MTRRTGKPILRVKNAEKQTGVVRLSTFGGLLFTITMLVLSSHDIYLFNFNNTICRLFLERNIPSLSGDAKFISLVTSREWWNYFEDNFIPFLHESAADKEDTLFDENIFIGTARLRQIRVAEDTCVVYDDFNRYFNSCYAPYDPDIEYKAPSFKGTKYYNFDEFPVSPLSGSVYNYVGPGYVIFLSKHRETNEDKITELKKIKWIDRGTRAILIEFVLFNVNLNIFSNIKFITEVLPTGTVATSSNISILPIHSLWSTTNMFNLITISVFYFIIVYHTSDEIWILLNFGFYNYLTNVWNYVDCGILVSAYVGLIQSVSHPYIINDFLKIIETDFSANLFLDDICNSYYVLKFSMAICGILSWMKIFRFISFNQTMTFFTESLRRGSKDILGFAFMFIIVFIAYALLGLLLFCDSNPGFATFPKSLLTMMRMLMGDFQYNLLERFNRIMGPIFFVSYILFVFFILLNMFLAVISDTYVNVRQHVLKRDENIVKMNLKVIAKRIGNFMDKLSRKIFKKPMQRKTAEQRFLEKQAALKEFYGDSTEQADENVAHGTTSKGTRDPHTEVLLISQRVKALEVSAEQFIGKLDRLIQKLEDKQNDQANKS